MGENGRNCPQSPLLSLKAEKKPGELSSITLIGYKKQRRKTKIVLNHLHWVQKAEKKDQYCPQSPSLGTKNREERPKLSSITFIESKKQRKNGGIVLNHPRKMGEKGQNFPPFPLFTTKISPKVRNQ